MATVKVQKGGKAPSGLKTGDTVVTAGGTYKIDSVNADGSYKSSLTDKNQTTSNYSGTYDSVGSNPSAGGHSNTKSSGSSGSSGGSSGYTPLVQSDVDYDRTYLSDDEYQALQATKQSYAYWQSVGGEEGRKGMDAAHEAAQAIRAKAGYQALADGSGYMPLATQYEATEAPSYSGSKWDSTADDLAEDLISMNYTDWTQSDQYKALADRYGQQGKLSMQDVLGQVSSRTGGLASSYAATAAQQQYNAYMNQLEEAAMELYSGERSDKLESANLANALAQQDYSRYQDQLSQYNTDRAFDYSTWQDWQNRIDEELEEQYDKEQTASSTAYSQAYSKAITQAEYGIFDGFADLGWTADEIAAVQKAYQEAQAYDRTQDSQSTWLTVVENMAANGAVPSEKLLELAGATGLASDFNRWASTYWVQ